MATTERPRRHRVRLRLSGVITMRAASLTTNHLSLSPDLTRVESAGVAYYTDHKLRNDHGILVAFSERHGGVSQAPYASLNMGAYVGDAPDHVVENRLTFLDALHLNEQTAERLVSAQQVHGVHTEAINSNREAGPLEIPNTDALITDQINTPLLLCFADCVPITLVDTVRRSVGVVHSGWRGTLDEIVAHSIAAMVENYHTNPCDIYAYIGPYIGPNHFEVDGAVGSQFFNKFDTFVKTFSPPESVESVHLDLAVAVSESLERSGVLPCNIVSLTMCTVENVDRFFSYRAEDGITGRHGALACLLP